MHFYCHQRQKKNLIHNNKTKLSIQKYNNKKFDWALSWLKVGII